MSRSTESLLASQVMTSSLVCAHPEQDLQEVEQLLIDRRISGVPVVDKGRLVGVLSRSDVARVQVLMNSLDGQVNDRLDWPMQADGFQHGDPPDYDGFRQMVNRLKVKDAMHEQAITCQPTTPLARVAAIMLYQHTHRVIVVEDDKPVGIISSLDLVKLLATGAA